MKTHEDDEKNFKMIQILKDGKKKFLFIQLLNIFFIWD